MAGIDEPTLILTAVSTALSAGGSILGGAQQRKAAYTQAAYDEAAAKNAELLGSAEESRQRVENRRLQGQQIAAVGASGLTLSGSALDFTLDQAVDAEMEALAARYSGQQQAYGHRQQAKQSRKAGNDAFTSGLISGAATLAGGAARIWKPDRK